MEYRNTQIEFRTILLGSCNWDADWRLPNLGETIESLGDNLKSSQDFRHGREFRDNKVECMPFTSAEIKFKDIKITLK